MPTGIGTAVVGSLVGAGVSKVLNRSNDKAAENANNAAADAAKSSTQIAQEQYGDWKTDFLPLQHKLVADANNMDSQAEYDKASEKAAGDVAQSFGAAKSDLTSRLASYGVDPTQGKFATQFSRLGLAEAAAGAGAQMKARSDVTDKARAYRADVYGLGKGVPATSMSGLNSAANTNLGLANYFNNQSSRNAAGIGSFVQKIGPGLSNFWNNLTGTPGVDYPNAATERTG